MRGVVRDEHTTGYYTGQPRLTSYTAVDRVAHTAQMCLSRFQRLEAKTKVLARWVPGDIPAVSSRGGQGGSGVASSPSEGTLPFRLGALSECSDVKAEPSNM